MTLKEARKIQKERETKAILTFLASVAFIALGTFLLFYLTDVLALSSIFYLLPVALLALAVKKTKIYKFSEPKEFVGNIVRMDVYPVKVGNMKGDDAYEYRLSTSETLEVYLIVENGKKSRSAAVLAGKGTWHLAEGKKVALMRFIYYPIIIE